jgi:hypothetical protein
LLPPHLERLCDSLLQEDHHLRPDARAALATLVRSGALPPDVPPHHRVVASPPPGDDRVRRWLAPRIESVGDGAFDVAIVEGPPRSGKSALLRWAHGCARNSGGLVLVGGCRRKEHIEYNVLDAAIDSLAGVLFDTLSDAELAQDLSLAAAAFPVLAGRRGSGPRVSRSRAFDALIRILASFAGAAGVYLIIDDLHRADASSLAFLDRLLERRPPGVAVFATIGSDVATNIRTWLDAQRRIAHRPLTDTVNVWSLERDLLHRASRGRPAGGAVAAGRFDAFSTLARRQLAEPQDARELREGGRHVPAVRAEGHGQPLGRLLLGGGRTDESQLENSTLFLAARR